MITAQRSAAAVAMRARCQRVSPPPSTINHANPGTANDSAVIRVRHAAAVATPRKMAFLREGSRWQRTKAHAENVTVAMNPSSRHPTTDHEISSYSIATINDSTTPAARDSITPPTRYTPRIVNIDPVIDAKLTATSWSPKSQRYARVNPR